KGGKIRTVAAAWSKRTALRAGYGAVIGVLIITAAEAYRIQSAVSKQHLEIYRHFVEQEEALSDLRRNLWLASIYVRDFFIHSTPDGGQELRAQLKGQKAENKVALAVLDKAPNPRGVIPQVRKSLGELWSMIEPIPATMPHASDKAEIEFLQRE